MTRRPTRGSVRYFEEMWRSMDLDECITSLAQMSYENERLRKRVATLEDAATESQNAIEVLHIQQIQLQTAFNLMTMRLESASRQSEGIMRWSSRAATSKPN